MIVDRPRAENPADALTPESDARRTFLLGAAGGMASLAVGGRTLRPMGSFFWEKLAVNVGIPRPVSR